MFSCALSMIGFTPLTAVDSLSRTGGQGLPFTFKRGHSVVDGDDDDDDDDNAFS